MESSAELNLGDSLKVPSVQEVARGLRGAAVPDRYLRPDQDPPATLNGTQPPLFPVVDLQRLVAQASREAELQKLHSACREWGFFQLVNHGISPSVIEHMKLEVQHFFQLPLAEKSKFFQLPGDVQGYGQAFVFSEDQKLEWGDMFSLITRPIYLRKPHLFENLSPTFREAMETFGQETQKLALTVLELMARSLGMEKKEMMFLFEDGMQSLRMNYYPPCPQAEQVIGLSPHSDCPAITFLLQVNEVQGLEIRKDGAWLPLKPRPDAFIVNIGDMLEIISNGVYPSIEHRATVNPVQERLSITAFHAPKATTEIGPAQSPINPDKPALFKRVIVQDYIKGLYAGELKGKALINSYRINT